MNAEDISACNWGQSRLTVAPKVERIPSLRICDKCTTKIPSYSPTFTNRKSKMGFTTCPHTGDHKRTYIGRQSNSHFFRTSHKSESSKCHWNLKSCLNVHRVSQITVFILLALCSLSSASSTDRRPLKLTDATKREDFRYFMKSKDDTEEMIMSRSAIAANLADSDDSLAFQTLKVIEKWGNHTRDVLLVAGKDHVYMLDSTLLHNRPEIAYMERLTWRTLSETRKECEMLPGQPPELCENFIRFVELMDNGELMVCGTNAYSPACRFYRRDQFNDNGFEDSDYVRDDKCRGQCFVPYNPLTSSASLYTNTEYGSQIFLAVVNDFNSQEPKIMRQDSPTLISNSLWLNDPTFLKIIEYKDKVYVFFREVAQEGEVEYDDKEKVTLARVAQVCKNDPGGVNILAQQWTSFLKARLHCGYPKRQHLQFSNMTSVTDIVSVSDESGEELDVVFATFTTPWDWQDASLSAVCAFSMKDIIKVFEEGSFAGEYELTAQQDVASSPGVTATPVLNRANTIKRSYPIPSEKEPVPRPGGCSKTHSPNTLYFAKIHPSMYDVIEPYGSAPLFISYTNVRATQVAADNNAGESGKLMIYIGTEDGNVLRLRGMLSSGNAQRALLIESVKVSNKEKCEQNGCGVRSLHVSRPPVGSTESKPSAFVAFTDHMVQFPLVRCSIYKSKECCSVDPDCGWNGYEKCVQRTAQNNDSLIPTSKDGEKIPETCNAFDRIPTEVVSQATTEVGIVTESKPLKPVLRSDMPSSKGGDDNKSLAQASAGNFLILAFFGGLLLGILIMVAVFFAYKHCSHRRRKHTGCLSVTINSKPKMKKVKRNESRRSDEIKENVVEDRGSNYMEMTKSPQHTYPLPPSPSLSGGDPHDYKKASTKYPKKHSSPKSPKAKAPQPPETVPLVGSQQSSPTKSQASETAQDLRKTATPEKVTTPQHISPVKENPNSNNSNNHYFAANFVPTTEPIAPPLPVKQSTIRRQQQQAVQPSIDPQPTPRKVTLPSRKYQSFAGFDRPKPPVPQKSHLAQVFAERNLRPHSLAPPKSVRKIEDISIPKQSYSMTPPTLRSEKSFEGFDQPNREIIIPKRRERPPSFRYNNAAPKEVRSPVPVAAPVAPVINTRSPDRDPLLFQY
ncbi:uncharacterized protein LOC120346291 isoform X3 [Styela clava]